MKNNSKALINKAQILRDKYKINNKISTINGTSAVLAKIKGKINKEV